MGLSIIILAAGQGTRMRSSLPKVLQPMAGKPLLAHVLSSADELNGDVPAPLSKLICDCIAPDPSCRVASMRDVVSRLRLIGHKIQRDEHIRENGLG